MDKSYIQFFSELRDNNNRPWFQANKARYDELRAQWIADIDRLIGACVEWAPEFRWLSGKESTFRVYRDTRFAADKTPYKTHISSALSPRGKSAKMAGFYISAGFEPDLNGIYGGIWNPDAAALRKLRNAIVDNVEEFEEILANPELQRYFPDWCGRSLKTIPKGWDKSHPQAQYLRLLDLGREHPVSHEFYTDPAWPERAADMMRTLKPLNDFINYSLFEE